MAADPARLRFVALDFLRFTSALGIVLFHYETALYNPPPGSIRLFVNFDAGVDFFFGLSGFVLYHAYGHRVASLDQVGTFLRRRLARIYPLHVAMLLAVATATTIAAIAGFHGAQGFSWSGVIPRLLLLNAWSVSDKLYSYYNDVSWTLSVELALYLAFPALAALLNRSLAGAVLLLAVCVAALEVASLVWNVHWLRLSFNFGVLRGFPSFLAGMCICRALPMAMKVWRPGWVWGVLAGLSSTGLLFFDAPRELILLAALGTIFTVASCEMASPPSGRIARILSTCGNWSFAVYMSHVFIGMAFFWTTRLLIPDLIPPLLRGALSLICVIVFAQFSFHWFETPMLRLLSGRGAASAVEKP